MARKETAVKAPKVVSPSLSLQPFAKGNRKAAVEAAGATTSNMFRMVPRDKIRIVPGFNLRVTDTQDYQDSIQALKRSILRHGWYKGEALGLLASKDGDDDVLYLISGHRRFEAAGLAADEGAPGLESLPAIIDDSETDPLELAVSLYKQNTGKPLTMLEQSVLAHRMLVKGKQKETEVAESLDITVRAVNDLKTLIGATKPVRDAVKHGKISATEAIRQLRKEPETAEERILALVEKAEKKGSKATAKTEGDEAEPSVKMATTKLDLSGAVGEEVPLGLWSPVIALIEGEDWYKAGKKKGTIKLLEPISVTVRVKRPKRDTDVIEDPAVAEEPEAPKASRKAGAKMGRPPRPLPENIDEAGVEEDDEGAPDLRALGVASPDESPL